MSEPTVATQRPLCCSFCGKSQHEAIKLIAGPSKVFICDECVGLCQEIIDDAPGGAQVSLTSRLRDRAIRLECLRLALASDTSAPVALAFRLAAFVLGGGAEDA